MATWPWGNLRFRGVCDDMASVDSDDVWLLDASLIDGEEKARPIAFVSIDLSASSQAHRSRIK
eukprot:scaffold14430_cov66-Cyclotella_meneghiniana.AAC.10